MRIDFAEIGSDEQWELFARDFFSARGAHVEIPPGRGADGGMDLLIAETLTGPLAKRKFRWLVSCKYYSKSGKAVGTTDETNIIDRVQHHKADGFIGFYSTIPSSALVERLKELVAAGSLEDYSIYDQQLISSAFYDLGMSRVALKYVPEGYATLRPIQKLYGEYEALDCEVCGLDLLKESLRKTYSGLVVWVVRRSDSERVTEAVYAVCKGECDRVLRGRNEGEGRITTWEDIGDLCNPPSFLQNMIAYMNRLYKRDEDISDTAHNQVKRIYLKLAQRTLREVTADDADRFARLQSLKHL